jgi:predicted MFS family arabinose efflux permease
MKTPIRPIILLAVGAFVVGTESFMISGLLPEIAADFGVSIPRAGSLTAIYSATYAICSPLFAIAAAKFERKRLLLVSLALFTLVALAVMAAPNFGAMLVCRVLLAAGAGIFMPTAIAGAVVMVPTDRRGWAISMIYVGYSIAPIVGVPFGTAMGEWLGWRWAYGVVALLGLIALAGLTRALPPIPGSAVVGLRQRFDVARLRGVPSTLLVTILAATGIFSIYTYIAVLVRNEVGTRPGLVEVVLLVWGLAGFVGTVLAAKFTDRVSTRVALTLLLSILACAFTGFTIAGWVPHLAATILVFATMTVWGLCGWGYSPIAQMRLVHAAPAHAAVVASLNSSATYIGCALGAELGALVVAHASSNNLGWVGALCELAGVAVLTIYGNRLIRVAETPAPAVDISAGT